MASTHAHARSAWSGKWAFILAAAASAVGLGNMWRFPYLAAKYGGGTFLLTYLVLVFTFGVSLLLLETALGRKTGQSAIGAFKQFGKKYAFIGILASTDLLAVDQASVDMVYALPEQQRRDLVERIESRSGLRQLEYMETLGMGHARYDLVSLS